MSSLRRAQGPGSLVLFGADLPKLLYWIYETSTQQKHD